MENQKFNYTYSAPTQEERREIDSIRKKYLKTEETQDKMEQLRRLDDSVNNPAVIWSLVLGVLGTLIFGLGFAMILEWKIIVFGVIVCIIGVVPSGLAYPIYKFVLEKQKKKYGEKIIKLTDELLGADRSKEQE